MKNSIRTRFKLGMIFLFIIILVLSVFSGFYLNKLSNKTSAILKENYLSVVYAREMSESIMNIDQEITTGFLTNSSSDSIKIAKELNVLNNSLLAEQNNITEPGEDKLVSDIATGYSAYKDSVLKILNSPNSVSGMVNMQYKSRELYQQLLLLSRMNGKAIEVKTDDAKSSSKSAQAQMSILATLCFLIGLSFIYSFASYFNQRFFELYNGIKQIFPDNFHQRPRFRGEDEFYEILLVFNEMAEKLKKNEQKMSVTLQDNIEKVKNSDELEELKKMLLQIKSMEADAAVLISKIEKK
jgi:two-component system, NtrC family, sensor histidine kinase KinB